ncbi:MAG: XTP/dITP diphosphatase [Myxococcota bacterium]
MQIVAATRNSGKLREISAKLQNLDIELLSLEDFPEIVMPPETGESFKENSREKASFVCQKTHLPTLADDSGICVDALSGAPGVYSARFAGKYATDEMNNRLLLEKLKDTPEKDRIARFVCVISLALPDGRVFFSEGVWKGRIATEPRGKGGFGYDPLFISQIDGKTAAELEPELKNSFSHRGKALDGIAKIIKGLIKEVEKE